MTYSLTHQHLDTVQKAIAHIILGQFSENGEQWCTQLVNGNIDGLMDNCLNVFLHSNRFGLIIIKVTLQSVEKGYI